VSTIAESVVVNASLADAWDYYFNLGGWPAWVDGFGRVAASDGYPEAGGSLRWSSTPAGRGEVTEQVLEHEPRRVHRIAFSDPTSKGELVTSFAIKGSGTEIQQKIDYALRSGGPFTWITDRLFIRSQVRGSMRRSLERLRAELGEGE
jgi:hypothetical protein